MVPSSQGNGRRSLTLYLSLISMIIGWKEKVEKCFESDCQYRLAWPSPGSTWQ